MNNFLIRSISGMAFTAITIAAILAGPLWYALLFLIVIAIMTNEYLDLTIGRKNILTKALTVTAAVTLFAVSFLIEYSAISFYYLLICTIPLFAIFIINLYKKGYNTHRFMDEEHKEGRMENGYERFPFAIAAVFYIALPLSMCNIILFNDVEEYNSGEYSPYPLLFMFIVLWLNDVGAYCFGSTIGKRWGGKMFPSISPKKSWAGFTGGVACGVIAAVIMSFIEIFEINTTKAIIIGFIICIFGVWGDLAESQLKRNFGVKDTGRIMPGHGGMLDRFDAALLAFPAAVLIMLFI